MLGSGAVGLWALTWLTRIPPLPNCEEISSFSSDSDRLFCAETQMGSSHPEDVMQAITLIAAWDPTHPLYGEALPVLTTASERLLALATDIVQEGDILRGETLAQSIPLNTPLRTEAQTAIWQWRQEWEAAKTLEEEIEAAIAAQDWSQAAAILPQFSTLENSYWATTRRQDWQQTLNQERQAWEQLQTAREWARQGNPDALATALTLIQGVPLGTMAWQETKVDIDSWSQSLLVYGFQRWEVGDIDGAVALVQQVPADPTLAPEAQDLIQFSHAQRLAQQAQANDPSYVQLFYLIEAIHAAAAIAPRSPFYETAQGASREWQAQLMDLQRLQLAYGVASWGHDWAFRYASGLAAGIDLEHPRRIQAQTLIAHWYHQIEYIQDRPHLVRARRFAQGGTVPDLQAAIAEAGAIALGRSLRIEAQTHIADWFNQIEVVEDQPIVNQATTLAAAGKLKEAAELIAEVEPGRVLYDQAQALSQEWTRTLQIQEDTPILARARSLATAGSLTAAIDVAAQIAPGRALYGEARRDINLWRAEREYIWSLDAPDAPVDGEAEDTPVRESSPQRDSPRDPPLADFP